ncbi:MAG TPA: hypothetical protein VFN55_17345 [Solirubrobacteraceae bacterium]|nr:hypothetical protein [Solirubrobacteraceae bacterium]
MLDPNFVFAGAALTLAGALGYARRTVRGETRPNRVTWGLWSLAPLIAGSAQLSEGQGLGAVLAFSVGLGPLIVFVSSFLSTHAHASLGGFDLACGLLSVLALILWLVLDSGTVAISMSIAADAFAAVPTLLKSIADPDSEHPAVFRNSAVNAAITLLTIRRWSYAAWGFPLWILVVCASLWAIIRWRIGPRLRDRQAASAA